MLWRKCSGWTGAGALPSALGGRGPRCLFEGPTSQAAGSFQFPGADLNGHVGSYEYELPVDMPNKRLVVPLVVSVPWLAWQSK